MHTCINCTKIYTLISKLAHFGIVIIFVIRKAKFGQLKKNNALEPKFEHVKKFATIETIFVQNVKQFLQTCRKKFA